MTPIAFCKGPDMSELNAQPRADPTPALPLSLRERGKDTAVVMKQCTKSRHLTMYLRICAALTLIQIFAGGTFAASEKKPAPPTGLFEGTPEEQAACAPDSTRFCRDFIPDNLRVLSCLQDHRKSLRKVCLKVLEDHGQ